MAIIKDYLELQTCSTARINKIKTILNHAKQIIGKPLTKLEVRDIVKYLKNLNESEYRSWTKNDHKKIFKRFLKWYYKNLEMIEGELVKEGFKGVSKKRAFNHDKINKNTLIKPQELEKLLRTAKSLKWKALISFMYESGFRPCEIVALRWGNLDFDDAMNICRVTIVSPKTKDKRTIAVRDCIIHLKRWREEYQFPDKKDNDFVFCSPITKEKSITSASVGQMLKRICLLAGIRPIYPYIMRHSRIYEIQKRLPEKLAAKFAGHSIETSEIYNHIADDDVESSMLKEIYPTKELSPVEKDRLKELEKAMQKQKNELQRLRKIIKIVAQGYRGQADLVREGLRRVLKKPKSEQKK